MASGTIQHLRPFAHSGRPRCTRGHASPRSGFSSQLCGAHSAGQWWCAPPRCVPGGFAALPHGLPWGKAGNSNRAAPLRPSAPPQAEFIEAAPVCTAWVSGGRGDGLICRAWGRVTWFDAKKRFGIQRGSWGGTLRGPLRVANIRSAPSVRAVKWPLTEALHQPSADSASPGTALGPACRFPACRCSTLPPPPPAAPAASAQSASDHRPCLPPPTQAPCGCWPPPCCWRAPARRTPAGRPTARAAPPAAASAAAPAFRPATRSPATACLAAPRVRRCLPLLPALARLHSYGHPCTPLARLPNLTVCTLAPPPPRRSRPHPLQRPVPDHRFLP